MGADSAAVEAAIVAVLAGDAALGALMPDGVYFDVAPSGSTRFVIVSLVTQDDAYMFGGTAYEEALYLVKAVERNTATGPANAAAFRIQTLLQDGRLAVNGYSHMVTEREGGRVAFTEVDPDNQDTRWQHRGARYAVWVSPEA